LVVVTVPSIVFSVDRGKFDPPSMGKVFAWGLYDLNQSKKVPKTVKAGNPELVTEGNVDQVTSWDDQLEEEYGG
jgi:hypothetical protein